MCLLRDHIKMKGGKKLRQRDQHQENMKKVVEYPNWNFFSWLFHSLNEEVWPNKLLVNSFKIFGISFDCVNIRFCLLA